MKRVRRKPTRCREKSWGCPRTKNRSNWCHGWCTPTNGLGDCGRVAPHGLLGRTQLAILAHEARDL